MKTSSLFLFIIALFICNISNSQTNQKGFTIIPLGVKGGLDESNLSAYLVKANGAEQFICLDAGTIYTGLQKAATTNYFTPLKDATENVMNFNQVRIPFYDESGKAIDARGWANDLRKYLKRGISYDRSTLLLFYQN